MRFKPLKPKRISLHKEPICKSLFNIHYFLCFLGHAEVVRVLLEANANVEDHNENGHTPLMEAASAGHVEVAKILLEYGAGINTHSNEVSFYF